MSLVFLGRWRGADVSDLTFFGLKRSQKGLVHKIRTGGSIINVVNGGIRWRENTQRASAMGEIEVVFRA